MRYIINKVEKLRNYTFSHLYEMKCTTYWFKLKKVEQICWELI